jgi:hypothetical protein
MATIIITNETWSELTDFAISQGIPINGEWEDLAVRALLKLDIATPPKLDDRPLTGMVNDLLNPDPRLPLTRLKSAEEVRVARQEFVDKGMAMGDNHDSGAEPEQPQPKLNSERNQDAD